MKNIIIVVLVILSTSLISKGQESLPRDLNQEEIIKLMDNPRKTTCFWKEIKIEIPKKKKIEVVKMYVKTIEYIPQDTSKIKFISFSSNEHPEKTINDVVIVSRNKKDTVTTVFEVASAEINSVLINFTVPIESEYTVKIFIKHQYPVLEAKMNNKLKTTATGIKWKK